MQSYDANQSSDSLFQNQGQQSRTALPPASSLFESTHQNRPFQSDLALTEPSSSFPSYNQPTASYDSQPYFSDQNTPSSGYNQGYPNIYGESSSMEYNTQMELYPQMPPQQIPMMQPPMPPEYGQQMVPESPMMYPPGPSVGYPQMEQNRWPQHAEYIQNQSYGQMQPMMTEVLTNPLPLDPNMNQPVAQTQFLSSMNSQFRQPIPESSYVQSYNNSTTDNYQQSGYNVGYMPPSTALVDYGHGPHIQLQYPQSQQNFSNYPEPQNASMPVQTSVVPPLSKKSSEACIADTVAEVIAKQTAKLYEEERAQASRPPPQPKKRRYVPTIELPYPDDGPTVRQILKQQQMEKKRLEQQEILKQQILEDEEKRKLKSAEVEPQNVVVSDAIEIVQLETTDNNVPENPEENEVVINETFEVPLQPSLEFVEMSEERSVSETPAIFHGDQIDTDVAAKIQEIGGFDGSTVGELAESIEFPAGVPTTTKRKRIRTRKPRKRPPKVDPIQKENNEKYIFKALHLQSTVRSLVLKNTALADEVSRLLYRIETAAEERKILAKRLQHYERNRIRRIVTQKKKRQALEAQQIQQAEFNRKINSSNVEVPAFAFNDFQRAEMAIVMPILPDLNNFPVLSLDEIAEMEENKIQEKPVVKKRPRGRPYKRPPPQPTDSDEKTTTTKRITRKRKIVQTHSLESAILPETSPAWPAVIQDEGDVLWGNQDLLEFDESGFGSELGTFQDDFHSFSTGSTSTNFANN